MMAENRQAERLPIGYSEEGEANLRYFKRRYETVDPLLYKKVVGELLEGLPLADPHVRVRIDGEHQWDILHPSFENGLEIDMDPAADVDVDPIGFRVFGYIEYRYHEGIVLPLSLFICTGVRELRPEFRDDILRHDDR